MYFLLCLIDDTSLWRTLFCVYSLLFLSQNFKAAFELLKAAYFRHGDKESLRSCVQAINFCTDESKGELQDFVLDKMKELEDELFSKLKSAMKEAAVFFFIAFFFLQLSIY